MALPPPSRTQHRNSSSVVATDYRPAVIKCHLGGPSTDKVGWNGAANRRAADVTGCDGCNDSNGQGFGDHQRVAEFVLRTGNDGLGVGRCACPAAITGRAGEGHRDAHIRLLDNEAGRSRGLIDYQPAIRGLEIERNIPVAAIGESTGQRYLFVRLWGRVRDVQGHAQGGSVTARRRQSIGRTGPAAVARSHLPATRDESEQGRQTACDSQSTPPIRHRTRSG